MKNLARLVACCATACLLLGAVASTAMAEEVAGKFSSSSIKLSGSNLTVKKAGGDPRTCQLLEVIGSSSGGFLSVYNKWEGPETTELTCTGGGMALALRLNFGFAKYDTVTGAYSIVAQASNLNSVKSPWGYYYWGYNTPYGGYRAVRLNWTNGTASTPSTIDFNEQEIGVLAASTTTKLTLTGSLKATTSTGGLLTMSH
jgi:hypothetical protein